MNRYDSEFQSARARTLTRRNRDAQRAARGDDGVLAGAAHLPGFLFKDSPR